MQDEIFSYESQVVSVSEYLGAVNGAVRNFRATIEGEITGRVNRRGAVTYFSLHDLKEDAVLPCMAFNNILDKNAVILEQGMAIKISGFPEIWARTGSFTFKVFEVLLTGEGALKRQFEALLKALEAEGLFLQEYKKAIPDFVTSVGLITSADREAQTDFVTHLSKKNIQVHLYDVRVEGAQSVAQIVQSIQWFNEYMPEIEVLVLTRGGGSLESLQSFNSESVARAIFASRIPIISAVGHEKDVTIADFVSDARASTPTHAGKIISKSWEEASAKVIHIKEILDGGMRGMIERSRIFLNQWQDRTMSILEYKLSSLKESLTHYKNIFTIASPELKLKQGYSIVRDNNGKVVKSVAQLSIDDMLEVQFNYGKAKTKITKLA